MKYVYCIFCALFINAHAMDAQQQSGQNSFLKNTSGLGQAFPEKDEVTEKKLCSFHQLVYDFLQKKAEKRGEKITKLPSQEQESFPITASSADLCDLFLSICAAMWDYCNENITEKQKRYTSVLPSKCFIVNDNGDIEITSPAKNIELVPIWDIFLKQKPDFSKPETYEQCFAYNLSLQFIQFTSGIPISYMIYTHKNNVFSFYQQMYQNQTAYFISVANMGLYSFFLDKNSNAFQMRDSEFINLTVFQYMYSKTLCAAYHRLSIKNIICLLKDLRKQSSCFLYFSYNPEVRFIMFAKALNLKAFLENISDKKYKICLMASIEK